MRQKVSKSATAGSDSLHKTSSSPTTQKRARFAQRFFCSQPLRCFRVLYETHTDGGIKRVAAFEFTASQTERKNVYIIFQELYRTEHGSLSIHLHAKGIILNNKVYAIKGSWPSWGFSVLYEAHTDGGINRVTVYEFTASQTGRKTRRKKSKIKAKSTVLPTYNSTL